MSGTFQVHNTDGSSRICSDDQKATATFDIPNAFEACITGNKTFDGFNGHDGTTDTFGRIIIEGSYTQ
jgi:hypothetical protein